MRLGKFLILMLFAALCQVVDAQSVIKGLVLDADTREPIVGATVTDVRRGKAITVTNADGRFVVPKNDYAQLRISYIGYQTLTTSLAKDGRYLLQSEVSKLGEVVVTAQESRGLTSSSVIQKHAMEHLQPSSFSDLLELLPGGQSRDPVLNAPNTIRLREADPLGANYATSSLGTSFMMDGAPISTNANMQYLSGAWETAATNRDFTNAGVDMRMLSTDDIEKVEIVRGIPSVEYGDLTSGLVKIERRKGGHDWQARLKADMGSKLFYVAKGLEWNNHTTLNLSADYLDSKADPRNTLNNYTRVTFSARLGKTWERAAYDLVLTTNADYTGSFDGEKQDPDLNNGVEDKYKSSYNRMAVMAKLDLKMKQQTWLKRVGLMTSLAYQHDNISRTRYVTVNTSTPALTTYQEGESEALLLPYQYYATNEVDGKPLNMYVKLNAQLQIPSKVVSNELKLGVDWNVDKNYGEGQVFDAMRPAYTGMSIRRRPLSEIPAVHTLSYYAEESLKLPIASWLVEVAGGIRASQLLGLSNNRQMHGKVYADPRVNIGVHLPRLGIAGQPVYIQFAGGIGQHTKFPTVEQLYPDPLYLDLIELNYYHANEDFRRMWLMTYVADPTNVELKPARNLKSELSVDVNVGGNRLSVTWFRENMTSGFRSQTTYNSYTYKVYDASGIDASTLTTPPVLGSLPYETRQELYGIPRYTNGSQTKKEGVEYTLSTIRFKPIMTRFTINGAYFKTSYKNSLLVMYRPSVAVAGRQIQYVGLYQDNDGRTNRLFNTNLTADTDIPKLKLGVSLSTQWTWFTMSQNTPLSNVPSQYMSPDGQIHDWPENGASELYLQYLLRQHTESEYKLNRVPLAMNVNLKVTKKLMNDRLRIAMYCNKILDYTPDYEVEGGTIRRHVTPYFGLEMNVKI